jgi:hypothetical protein
MTVSRMHNLHAVKFGNTLIPAITKRGIRTGAEVRQEQTSGEVYARFQALYAVKPMADIETRAIVTALGACALTGMALNSSAPFLAYAQKNAEGSTRASGGNHRKATINEGLIIPRKLTVEHQGDAVLTYEVLATYDGSNEPVVFTESQSLVSLTDTERFTLGPVTLANADGITTYALSQVKRMEIDFGIRAETVGADSDIYDTSSRIIEIDPSIRLTGNDSFWWHSSYITLTGKNIQHSGTKIFLRKRAEGSTFVADGTAEHVKFTAAGLVVPEGFDASGNALDETTLYFPLKFDGTTNPITINTAAAIA